MKALVYDGPFDVSVENVPDARVEQPTDAVVRITTTNICGSDLHMFEGRTDVEQGKVLGHENMGVVEAVGDAVGRVEVGDRVSLPFNIACGTCANCLKRLTGFCLRANPRCSPTSSPPDGTGWSWPSCSPARPSSSTTPDRSGSWPPTPPRSRAPHGCSSSTGSPTGSSSPNRSAPHRSTAAAAT